MWWVKNARLNHKYWSVLTKFKTFWQSACMCWCFKGQHCVCQIFVPMSNQKLSFLSFTNQRLKCHSRESLPISPFVLSCSADEQMGIGGITDFTFECKSKMNRILWLYKWHLRITFVKIAAEKPLCRIIGKVWIGEETNKSSLSAGYFCAPWSWSPFYCRAA